MFSRRQPETRGETTIRAIFGYVNDILLNSTNKLKEIADREYRGRFQRRRPVGGSDHGATPFLGLNFVSQLFCVEGILILRLMASARLELQQGQDRGTGSVVTRLDGKLSLETVNSFLQTMRQEQAKHVVLDMSGVSFLDSAGVGALVSLFVTRKHAGKTLALAILTKQAMAVLQLSGILKLIPAYPTVEAAVKTGE